MEEQNSCSQPMQQPMEGYQQQAQPSNSPQLPSEQDWNFLNQNFKTFVPPQYQNLVSRYNSFTDLLDSYNAQQALIGKKVSDYAGSDWKAYSDMVQQVSSIPADPSGYNFEYKEGSLLTEEDDNLCRDMACDMGLNNDQANLLRQNIENYAQAIRDADYQQQMSVQQELEQRWGNNYAYKEQAINNAFASVLPQLFGESVEAFGGDLQSAMARYPTVARLVAAVGELAMTTPTSGYGSATTPQGAAATVDQLQNDPEFMNKFLNHWHPGHKQAKETMQQLLKLKNMEL